MTVSLRVVVWLPLLAAASPGLAQGWKLPERGAVFYERTQKLTPKNYQLVGMNMPQTPAVFCQGELDPKQQHAVVAPSDMREFLTFMAFDFRRLRGGTFKFTVPYFGDVRPLQVQGKAFAMDKEGRQKITAKLTKGRPIKRANPFVRYTATGTFELTRTVDVEKGLITGFTGKLDVQLEPIGPVNAGFPGPPAKKQSVQYETTWKLKRVEKNRYKGFEARVQKAIRAGAEALKAELAGGGGRMGGGEVAAHPDVNVPVGRLALILLTLLKADVDRDDPVVKKGFERLRAADLEDSYALGVALMAMEALYAPAGERRMLIERRIQRPLPRKVEKDDLKIMQEWADRLRQNFDTTQKPEYLLRFHYTSHSKFYDNSNTQYALLGLYSAHLCGVKIPKMVWFGNGNHWVKEQLAGKGKTTSLRLTDHKTYKAMQAAAAAGKTTGTVTRGPSAKPSGWPYINDGSRAGFGSSTGSMTTAGIAGARICEAVLTDQKTGGAVVSKLRKAQLSGFAWLFRNFSVHQNPFNRGHYYYYLYGLERACELHQVALINHRDWYFEGATMLLELQLKAGERQMPSRNMPGGGAGQGMFVGGGAVQTCFAVLFLKQQAPPVPVLTGGR